jgi:tetratricopeptide (TPR) repeat protein
MPLSASLLVVTLSLGAQAQDLTEKQQSARQKLEDGVQAYRHADFDEAIKDFQQAAVLDPSLINAHLYLATAYASQFIPGAPTPDNVSFGTKALDQFQSVLAQEPNNLPAIDGIGSVLYNLGGNPFDRQKLEESKTYHLRHIRISPNDPEPYYWVGVIDWGLAFHAERQIREDWTKQTAIELPENEPLTGVLLQRLRAETQTEIEEGMKYLKTALDLRPDYDDAMAYLNLIYREKANTETDAAAREQDIKAADDLVRKVMDIKQARMRSQAQQQ